MKHSIVLPALLAILLAGCGGGGGGGGSASTATTAAPAVVITQASAPTVGAHGLDAAQDNSSTTTAGLLTGVQVDGSAGMPGPVTIAGVARSFGQRAAGLSLATGVSVDRTSPCANGGTIRVSGSVASNTGLNTGDSLSIAASNCTDTIDGHLTTVDGTLRFDVTGGFLPNSGAMPYHVVLRVTTVGLSIQVGSNGATSDGDMTLDLTASTSTSQVLVVSGSSLASKASVGGVQRTRTLSAYSQKVTLNGTAISESLTGSVASSSTKLGANGGSFTLSTPQDLRWTTTSNTPVGGQLKIVGANNGAVLLTFDATGATIQVDADGNGSYESSSTATVAQLRALL